jgi:PAS domain S-box-containing protein
MARALRILIVEDSEDDAALLLRELRRGGYDPIFERVETADAMRAALGAKTWDVIASDYAMPRFSVPAALEIVKESGLDVPFLIVSGAIGEDRAVAAMKAGAHDYVMKDRLARIVPAIEREMREAEVRRKRRQAEEALGKKTGHMELLQRVAVSANEAGSVDEAMKTCVEEVCASTGWPVGHVYMLADDGTGELVPTKIWHLDRPEEFKTFHRVTEKTRFAPGVGLPGRVLTSGKPAWIADVTKDPNFPRAKLAKVIGVKGGFAFPVLVGREVVAVLEFFAAEAVEPDRAILEVMGPIGTQLGRVVERKRAEEALRRSEERFKVIAEAASDWFWEMGPDLRFTYHSDRYFEITGFRPGDKIGTSRSRYVDLADLEADARQWAAHEADLEARRPFKDFEYAFTVKDGGVRHVRTSGAPFFGAGGEFLGYRGTGTDITERKRAEEELRESETSLSNAQRIAHIGNWEWNVKTNQVRRSAEMKRLLGMTPEDPDTTWEAFLKRVHRGDRETVDKAIEGMIEKREPFSLQFRIVLPDGTVRVFYEQSEVTIDDAGEPVLVTGTTQDITERAQAEETFRRIAAAIEGLSETFVLFDADDRIVVCNKTFRNLNRAIPGATAPGTRFEDYIRTFVSKGLAPEALGREEEWIQERLERHRKPHGPFEVARQDGRCLLVSERRLADGGTATIATDITERKRAEEALRESEERYRDLYENAPVAYASISASDGSILRFNSTLLWLLGYDRDDLKGMNVFDFYADTPDGLPKAKPVYQNFKGGESTRNAELQMKRKDGAVIWISLSVEPVRDAEGKVTESRSVFVDITDRKQAEAQVVQAAKLATLGEIATSVAHELNQPLNVIRMAAGNVMRRLEKGSADAAYLSEKLERIASQTARAAAIIDHMRMFGRKAEAQPAELDPGDTVRDAVQLMSEQLRLAEIEVSVDIPETCRPILGHRVQMEQVLLNLLSNARDAIEGNHGERKITLAVDDTAADTVRIVVGDTGGGIPDEAMARLFEPFYTTKKTGEGTGLGLSVSYGIVRDMGGMIAAENAEGGARFTVTLPIAGKS